MSTQSFQAKGMHCRSCEILIRDKVKEEIGAENVNVSHKTGEVSIESSMPINIDKLNKVFKEDGYHFTPSTNYQLLTTKASFHSTLIAVGVALLIGVVFLLLGRLGLASNFQVSSTTALGGFFLFGLLAGSSTCAALVGGLVLSMTKRWSQYHSSPINVNLLFNVGRILAYALFGYALGSLGSMLQFSASTTFLLTMIVVIVMVAMGLNMLGINVLNSLIPNAPSLKSLPKSFANLGPFEPLALGAITLFLPCGFTFAAQTAAVASGDPVKGMLMLGIFALGTAPVLMLIGLSSRKALGNPKYSDLAVKTAGVLVIFFALQMVNAQLNAVGIGGINTLIPPASAESVTAGTANGRQIVDVGIFADHFEPAVINLEVGVPTTLRITDKGMSGCTSAVMARGLFDTPVQLNSKGTIEQSFTPEKTGRYVLSCWMGMVTSTINVIAKGATVDPVQYDTVSLETGASNKGCSCGDGGCQMNIR